MIVTVVAMFMMQLTIQHALVLTGNYVVMISKVTLFSAGHGGVLTNRLSLMWTRSALLFSHHQFPFRLLEPFRSPDLLAGAIGVTPVRSRLWPVPARGIGGDRKEDPTRLTEVDRVEVLPILDRSHVHPLGGERLSPALLLGIAGCPPDHMMDTPSCNYPAQDIRPATHIDQRSWSLGSDFITEDLLFFGQQMEPKRFGQEVRSRLVAFFPDRHTVKE